tara:strand:- start:10663 stop:15243 length:4581 start_codon:yes stop_codon:yes gene_type:complete
MPIIEVKGLGKVNIAGDRPTEAERQNMLIELGRRSDPAVAAPPTAEFTPEQIETAGFGDLAQTMRGFQGLEAPVGREFWGDYEHPLQSEFVRPLAAGVSALPRGVLKGALAGAEVVAGRPFAPELVELEQSWKDWEVGLTEGGRPEDDDIYAVLGKAKGGDFAPLLSLVGRGMVQAAPGMYAAIQNMPAYMGTLIGDYAERAAADRGSDSIEFNDLSRGIAMAGAVAGIEKASALKALSGAGASTVKGAAARGALIEGGEEYTQQHLENIGIQAGSDRPGFLGVDWAEGHKGGIHGLAIGAPMGGLMGGGAAMRRNDTIGELGRRIADVPARREARLLQEVADLEAEAAPVAEEVAPVVAEEAVALEPAEGVVAEEIVTPAEEGRPWQTPKGEFVRENTNWDPNEGYDQFNPARKEGAGLRAYVQEHVASENIGRRVSFAHFPPRSWVDLGDGLVLVDEGAGYRKFYILKNTEVDHPTPSLQAGRREGDIVGLLAFDTDEAGGVAHFALSPELRGKGYGDALLSAATDAGLDVTKAKLRTKHFSSAIHRFAVKRALDAGKPVPAEVLKDYPDLAPTPAEPVVEAVIEEVDTPTGTVTGYRDQVAPPALPIEAIDEQAQAIEVQMEKDRLAAQVREARKAAEEAAKEREVAPRPSGAKLRAVVDKGAKRRRVEEIDTPPEPMSAKDAIRRLAMVANESRSTEADVTDAVNEAAAAELRESGQAIAPRNADNIDRIKQLAREMGRTDEEIDQLLSHQKMSFADVITAMDDAGLRSKLSEDGTDVEIPAATETLITEVNESRLSPTNTQIAAIHAAYRATSTARANVLLAAEQATDSREIAKLAATDAKLRALALNALLAQKRGGTPAAQAMRFRQYLIDPVMNVVEAQARATLKKRKPLTSQEVARLERLWDAAEKAESQAAEAETKAQKALKKAARRLKSAENALRASEEVQKEAKKKARKPKKGDGKEKTPRQKAAEIEGAPIRVTPIKKSARQKELEKAFKATQKEARKAADGVQKAKAKTRKAQRAKGAVPDKAVHPWLALYRKAFGGALVLNSSGDNSALGRQALGLAIQMPATAWQTIDVALSAAPWRAGHRKYALDKQLELLSSPNQGLRDFADLEMTEVEGRSNIDDETDPHRAREEAWMFRAFETGMLADVLVQPSQNIFGLTLNILRTEAFDEGARLVAEVNGVNLADMRKADLRGAPDGSKEKQFANDIKALGLLVNVSTGRGTFNAKALGVARHLMFAPRYTMSRFELPWRALELAAGKGKFSDVSPEARALFMRRARRQMSWAMGMMVMSGIAAAYNDDDAVEAMDNFFNPENADFLKMRIGDYHIDTMQGLGATWRYVWPFVFSPASTLEDFLKEGKLPDAHVPWRKEHLAPLKQLSRNKLAPLVSWLVKVGRGTDWRGRGLESIPASERGSYKAGLNPDNAEEATMAYALDRVVFPTLGLVTPIGVQQMAEAFGRDATAEQKSAFQKGIPIVLNFFGISAAHYKDRAKKGKSLGLPGLPRPPSVPRPPLTRFD